MAQWALVLVCVATTLSGAVTDKVKFKDCGSKSGTISSVDVKDCSTEPCQFVRNTTAVITVEFTANADITAATNKMFGYIAGIKVPFPIGADGCKNMTCPISKGAAITYQNGVFIQEVYPKVRLVAELQVLDQSSQMIICLDIPAQISDP